MTDLATLSPRADGGGGLRRVLAVSDGAYRGALGAVAALFAALLVALVTLLVIEAHPAFAHFGFSFLTGTKWDPTHVHLGALVFVVGTVETTAIAMVLALPVGLGCALALAFGVPRRLQVPLGAAVELLAAVPSVVYGLWGLLVVAPWVRTIVEPALAHITGGRGPFGGSQEGVGLLLAGVILAIMVLPTLVAISRDVLVAVPQPEVEGAFALGATRWQVMRRVVVPSARSGLLGATTLATGRALGETIAVTMVIGNTNAFSHSLFGQTATLSSVIANEFTEATEPYHQAALIGLALVLLVVALVVNLAARLLVRSVKHQGAIGVGLL
ncbi:MAG TPA: phosphate ABC transporter permease subunit PstC [Acidimicrobiales bacterium]|nr:phosphate ABC transporter permease subunit PstC [Acidimicrobiales bacterium]